MTRGRRHEGREKGWRGRSALAAFQARSYGREVRKLVVVVLAIAVLAGGATFAAATGGGGWHHGGGSAHVQYKKKKLCLLVWWWYHERKKHHVTWKTDADWRRLCRSGTQHLPNLYKVCFAP
jgi:hypothetical protein